MKIRLQKLLTLLILISCVPVEKHNENTAVVGEYGHLQRMNYYSKTDAYLIYFSPGKTYNVCISDITVKKYKGIKSEIEAAINIWGHYIGRKIPVNFSEVNLPIFNYSDSVKFKRKTFRKKCPKNTHLMFGLEDSFFNNKAGATNFKAKEKINYKKGKLETVDFARWVFITDSGNYNFSKGLISLEELTGKKRTADEILKMMIERKTTLFGRSKFTTHSLPLIVHEIGHVWGMCDQYDMPDGRTNCDPHNSSHNEHGHHALVYDSIMNKVFPISQAYLSDDDIIGIKKLASRSDLEQVKWPDEHNAPEIGKKIGDLTKNYFFKVNKIKLDNDELKINLSLFSKKSFKLNVYKKFEIENFDGVTEESFKDIYTKDYPTGSDEFLSYGLQKGSEGYVTYVFENVFLFPGETLYVSVERGDTEVIVFEYRGKNKQVKREFNNMMPN